MEFKVGTVVQLKSGGPLMTVTDPRNEYGTVDTVWFNQEGNVYTPTSASFKPEQLKNKD
ncbi:DUF2158 domain-containing protein [Sinorhizobium meliloti WSM1022]|uniref:YodC family protein n=1 Tax=Rhizobium meliloti TaxID=382 RepID=UPI0009B87CB7|nr:DUF2158 domain-containing protein [Sinorhizobium meliloti]MDW9891142.1 DUF2158 domain-containing protein [Sinorhizobium meliloti]MDX0022901.1 DUF2158 domain-containing protein [Sinorhizobium meliloti]MDX0094189.1 DUF2158 domain-containing protein [Sinorhizobium meliloti]MDX0123866.1 DUF2158 domain-containing protein [Sinorhizobium meliloti]MDX0216725.1 DUF2158 domain-containing protein [Sinorhizobium meliloti]